MRALNLSAIRDRRLGNFQAIEGIYARLLTLARARNDQFFEIGATQNLAFVAAQRGELARAAAMYESVLPKLDRVNQASLYATVASNLGSTPHVARRVRSRVDAADRSARIVLGARRAGTDRARIELARRDPVPHRKPRARARVTACAPCRSTSDRGDQPGFASALRIAGNAASELGQHDLALEYLRRAEKLVIERLTHRTHARAHRPGAAHARRPARGRAASRERRAHAERIQPRRRARRTRAAAPAPTPQCRSPRRPARGGLDLCAPATRLQPHRHQLRARAGAARRGRREWRVRTPPTRRSRSKPGSA